ncbi:hypothetical protein [Aquabacter spiritensis]|nr:hypothetical protein [Aquabacter spiritensis]
MPKHYLEAATKSNPARGIGTLSAPIAEGGAGHIYRHPHDPSQVIKLYKPDRIDGHADKISYMAAVADRVPPPSSQFRVIWPKRIIADVARPDRPLGFSMEFLDARDWVRLDKFSHPILRRQEGLSDSYRLRLLAVRHLAMAINALHAIGAHIIDLKPENIMVSRSGATIAIIDCDGMQLNSGARVLFPAALKTLDYTAPEFQSVAPNRIDNPANQDGFAFAVIAFRLLNRDAIEPFSGITSPRLPNLPSDAVGRSLAGMYAFGLKPDPRIAPQPQSIHTTWPLALRQAFDSALASRNRPSMQDWLRITDLALRELNRCKSSHYHFGHKCHTCGSLSMPGPSGPSMPWPSRLRNLLVPAGPLSSPIKIGMGVCLGMIALGLPISQYQALSTPRDAPPKPTSLVVAAPEPPLPATGIAGRNASSPPLNAPLPPIREIRELPPPNLKAPVSPTPSPLIELPSMVALPPEFPSRNASSDSPSLNPPALRDAAPTRRLPPSPSRLVLPDFAGRQITWLGPSEASTLVDALDTKLDGERIVVRTSAGSVLAAQIGQSRPPCRSMEIYPRLGNMIFISLLFCPDTQRRWVGRRT